MIATRRLLLRPLTAEDARFVVGLLNDPDFLRHIGDRGVRDDAGALAYIAQAVLMAVVERVSGRAVGLCGLLRRDFLDLPDLGYAFLPAGRGMGYAWEAASAVLAAADEDRIAAIVSPDNPASIALLEALGFRLVRLMDHPDGDRVLLYEKELREPADVAEP